MTKFSRDFMQKTACFLLVFSLFSFSVKADDQQNLTAENQSETSVSAAENSSLSENWNWNAQNYDSSQGSTSSFLLFIKMVFSLLIVLGLAYLAVRLLKRGSKITSSDDPFMRHVSHLSLASNRSVDIITILDHAYLIGVSDNSVNLIGQIDDQELVNSMNLYADKNDNSKRPRSFDDILSIFMPGNSTGVKNKNRNIYGSSVQNAADLLQKQRTRLNEEN